MTRKAQVEGAESQKTQKPLGDVLTAFIEANPEKWEEMRLWPAQHVIPEIVKLSK